MTNKIIKLSLSVATSALLLIGASSIASAHFDGGYYYNDCDNGYDGYVGYYCDLPNYPSPGYTPTMPHFGLPCDNNGYQGYYCILPNYPSPGYDPTMPHFGLPAGDPGTYTPGYMPTSPNLGLPAGDPGTYIPGYSPTGPHLGLPSGDPGTYQLGYAPANSQLAIPIGNSTQYIASAAPIQAAVYAPAPAQAVPAVLGATTTAPATPIPNNGVVLGALDVKTGPADMTYVFAGLGSLLTTLMWYHRRKLGQLVRIR